jgi:hypothetical protein
MSARLAQWSADQVLALMDRGDEESTAHKASPQLLRGYREAAAVLAAIAEPHRLRPVGQPWNPGEATDILCDDLILSTASKFPGWVMLAPDVRRMTLKDLVASGRIEQALAANPQERTGPLQKQLEHYLHRDPTPLEQQSLEQLDETHQVVLWLGDVVEGLPTADQVQARAAYLRLLAPFESIAGDEIFRGRRSELDQLRSYIGVVKPTTLKRKLQDFATQWIRPERRPALSISGPGGVGKSALVARFMLEHTRLAEEDRVPFAYLDFDRPDLDVGDPVGLCAELVRQLDIQFAGRFGGLLSFVEQFRTGDLDSPDNELTRARSILADLLGMIESQLGPRPYVVVLDTFEEVQYRGEARAHPLWELLTALQTSSPFLRVVLSGRAPVQSLRLADRDPYHLVVSDLDSEAAAAFLRAQGISDSALAQQLVRTFGGVPLTLKLVASLVVKNQEELSALRPLGRRGTLLRSVTDEVIQGQLYDRILDHIRNDQVRRLAHPGLVLRRISPEVILNVLNDPCELGLTTIDEAGELFKELQRETSLVSLDPADESLVHRADLRRMMLKLLIATEPGRVASIRRAAVAWYAGQTGRRAKAEELYHRLYLGEQVEEADFADGEIRSSIQASVVELPVDAQLQLVSFGFHVDEKILNQATEEQHDAFQAAQIEELLPYGGSSELAAAKIVRDMIKKLDRPSPIFRAAARLALQGGDSEGASTWIERGLEQSVPSGHTHLTLGLIQEKAWLQRDNEDALPATLDLLADYARRHRNNEALLQYRLLSLGRRDEKLERSLMALDEIVGQTQSQQIWALLPAFRTALELVIRLSTEWVIHPLRERVLAEDSPFRHAIFPDREAQAALEELLRATTETDGRSIARTFHTLCDKWPYRVLFVRPPYGRRGEVLSESLAT